MENQVRLGDGGAVVVDRRPHLPDHFQILLCPPFSSIAKLANKKEKLENQCPNMVQGRRSWMTLNLFTQREMGKSLYFNNKT